MKFEIGDLVKLSSKSGDQNIRGIIIKIQKDLDDRTHYIVNWIWLDNNSHFWYSESEIEKA